MSIKMMATVWESSPYAGTQRLIHLALADFADDEGYLFPKQETIAKKAACSRETVNRTIQKMAEDGYLEIISRHPRNAKYRLIDPTDVTDGHTSDVTNDHIGDVTNRHTDVTNDHMHRTVIEPSSRNRQKTSSRGARRKEGPVRNVGAFGDQPEPEQKSTGTRNKLPVRGTQAWVVRRFHNEAAKSGHRRINEQHLRRCIRLAREKHGLSYDDLDKILDTFFIRYADLVRSCDDPVKLLDGQMGRLMRETSPAGAPSAVEVGEALRPKLIGE